MELAEELAITDKETGGEPDPIEIVGGFIDENRDLIEEKGVEIQRELHTIPSNIRGGYSLRKCSPSY